MLMPCPRAPVGGTIPLKDDAGRVIANINRDEGSELATSQQQDELQPIIHFLETGVLPFNTNLAKKIALTASQYTVEVFSTMWRLMAPCDSL